MDKKTGVASDAAGSTDTASGIQFDTIAHIFDTAKEVMEKPYANLRFNRKLELTEPECCGKLRFRVVKGFDQEYKTLFPKYAGDDYDEKYISVKPNIVPKGPDYENEATGEQISVGENGFFAYKVNVPAAAVTDTILMENGYEDSTVALADGEIRLSEAAKRAQEIADTFTDAVGDSPYRLYKANILQNEETGKNILKFTFQVQYGDIGLHCMNDSLENDGFQVYYATEIYIESKEEYHIINQQLYETPVMEEEFDRIVTLETALKLVTDKLADYHVYDVEGIALEYQLSSVKNRKEDRGKVTEPGEEYTAVPYWVIYLDITDDQEVYASVNCETGKIKFINRANWEG